MFQNLDEKELETIINAAEEKKVKQGEYIIKQDDDGDHLFVVISGNLKCTKIFPGEKDPKFLLNYTPGSAFGELALLYNVPRAASIQASEDSTLYSLDRECFNHIVKGASQQRREQYSIFLEKVEILKTLDDQEKSKIVDCLRPIRYKAGEYIIKQGEDGHVFYLIEEGKGYAEKKIDGEEAKRVFDYKVGDYFGELALLREEPRAASVIAEVSHILSHLD